MDLPCKLLTLLPKLMDQFGCEEFAIRVSLYVFADEGTATCQHSHGYFSQSKS